MEQVRVIKEMRAYDKANVRSADAVRPQYMCWENVPGAFSSSDSEDFRAVLEETCRIADSSVSVPRLPGGVRLTFRSHVLNMNSDNPYRAEHAAVVSEDGKEESVHE